jgi:hypothetical protein
MRPHKPQIQHSYWQNYAQKKSDRNNPSLNGSFWEYLWEFWPKNPNRGNFWEFLGVLWEFYGSAFNMAAPAS